MEAKSKSWTEKIESQTKNLSNDATFFMRWQDFLFVISVYYKCRMHIKLFYNIVSSIIFRFFIKIVYQYLLIFILIRSKKLC
jgi:hypothetical protein